MTLLARTTLQLSASALRATESVRTLTSALVRRP